MINYIFIYIFLINKYINNNNYNNNNNDKGYLPCNSKDRENVLKAKRNEYIKIVTETFKNGTSGLDQSIYHQVI